ncbi:hypothetical protein [Pseudodonghicola flavimaris]|uniref:Lipoprotein n=1 Tax=Pseudodonghicola flavimaris TaxID=3050036 RepID=A0ABT7EV84_9RHOB|nr:hypothetical protein [Pseudodonghicola flavimaris]MDK3016199.1 hypothetical protein [Pseudodonghicola flavimaris]
MIRAALISPLLLGACGVQATGDEVTRFAPDYQGVETRLLDGDLVQFDVSMTGARDQADVDAYAECAAAQYALIRGYGFARHLRTNVYEEGGVWRADAVYTISPSLPRGLRKLDAEVVVAHCAENGIPTV